MNSKRIRIVYVQDSFLFGIEGLCTASRAMG